VHREPSAMPSPTRVWWPNLCHECSSAVPF
jgi:hypothetical protein